MSLDFFKLGKFNDPNVDNDDIGGAVKNRGWIFKSFWVRIVLHLPLPRDGKTALEVKKQANHAIH